MSLFPVLKPRIYCASCKVEQSITDFRILAYEPLTYVDFCASCESKIGTLTMYRDRNLQSATTPAARNMVLSGTDQASVQIEQDAVNYREEQRREFARRELSRKYLLYYTKQFNPSYKAGWVHKDIARRLEKFVKDIEDGKSPRLVLCVPPRHGKACADSTPVFTTEGWKTHGELKVGDYVFSPAGKPVKVVAVSTPSEMTLEVKLTNGASFKVHPNHEWTVYSRPKRDWMTVETNFFMRTTRQGKPLQLASGGRNRYQLPQHRALKLPPKPLPIHPYMLGVWLGDGTAAAAQFCFAEKDRCIADAVSELGYETSGETTSKATGVNYVRFRGVLTSLRELGILGAKRIPELYLRGSITQRLELLAGLIDTDGHVSPDDNRVRIATCSDGLRDDIMELVRGLGMHPYCYTQAPSLSSSGIQGRQPVHYVGFQPVLSIPTRVPRKQITRFVPQTRISIAAVEPCAPEPGRCIQVDAEDGLYLIGRELVPTHNSTLASQELPSWVLGRHPEWEIISASYAINLPVGFSRIIKDRIESPEYKAIFPGTDIRPDARGVEEWLTTKRGRYRAVGVEGGITGTGANILIIDDPIKDYQEAQSETIRDAAYNWYTTTARTRLSPGGGVLLIQTRWHDSDLAGRLLADQQTLLEAGIPRNEMDDWEVITYPAIAECDEWLFPDRTIQAGPEVIPEGALLLRPKDEALHPERYSALELRRIRNSMPPSQWNALYQQNPVPETGEYFTKEMFRTYTSLPGQPEDFAYFMAWDLAIGEKSTNDWTVGTVCAYDYTGSIYILDMIRARMNAPGIIAAALALAKKWPLIQVLGMEYGQIYKTMAPLLKEAMKHEKVRFALTEELKPVTDKLLRARPLQQKMQMGMVYFPVGQPWTGLIEREMLRFPNGSHDDIVDSLAWLARMAMVISPPRPHKAEKKRHTKSWKDELNTRSGGNFMTA